MIPFKCSINERVYRGWEDDLIQCLPCTHEDLSVHSLEEMDIVTCLAIPKLQSQRNVDPWSCLGQASLIRELWVWWETLLQKIKWRTPTHIFMFTRTWNADNYIFKPQSHPHCWIVSGDVTLCHSAISEKALQSCLGNHPLTSGV